MFKLPNTYNVMPLLFEHILSPRRKLLCNSICFSVVHAGGRLEEQSGAVGILVLCKTFLTFVPKGAD